MLSSLEPFSLESDIDLGPHLTRIPDSLAKKPGVASDTRSFYSRVLGRGGRAQVETRVLLDYIHHRLTVQLEPDEPSRHGLTRYYVGPARMPAYRP